MDLYTVRRTGLKLEGPFSVTKRLLVVDSGMAQPEYRVHDRQGTIPTQWEPFP